MSSSGSTSTRASDHALSYYSSSSETSLFDDISDIDRDGFLQSGQSAGGPYLCSLPAFRQPIGTNYHARAMLLRDNVQIEQGVSDILDSEGIDHKEISIIGRRSKVDPEPWPVLTVLIIAKRRSLSENWQYVTRRIHSYVATLYEGISVELLDEELDTPVKCFPIRQTDTIFPKWNQIRDTILRELTIWDWSALECWRFGRSDNPLDNPPTIIVSIRKDSERQFRTDMLRIKGILALFGENDVSILFMKDDIKAYTSVPSLPEEACAEEAQPGVSIGIHDSSAGSSTLGGMIELRFLGDPKWHRFALTCFHCVFPPQEHRGTLNLIPDAEEG